LSSAASAAAPASAAGAGAGLETGLAAPGFAGIDASGTAAGTASAAGAGAAGAPLALPGSTLASAAAPAASEGFSLGGAGSWLMAHPSAALGGLGLASSLLKSEKKPAGQPQLEASAANLSAQGNQLAGYLGSGTLPPGVGASLQAAHDAAAATVKSRYAARGQSGSSAEQAELANLAQTSVSQGASIASNLLSQGISEQQLSNQIYSQLMAASINQDNQLSGSIAKFAGSLAGAGMKG
jgi:hypothetical protein